MTNIGLKCPVGRCTGRRREDQIACSKHWFKLPKYLRDEIWNLYRTQRGGNAHRELVFSALQWLEAHEPTSGLRRAP